MNWRENLCASENANFHEPLFSEGSQLIFLSATSLHDEIFLPSLALRQNLDKNQNLDKQINSNVRIPPKKNSRKKSSQKISPKNSSKKIPPKKNPPEKFQKNSKKFQKQIQTISKKILKKFLRFWKYIIPYIALRDRKPFLNSWAGLNWAWFWQSQKVEKIKGFHNTFYAFDFLFYFSGMWSP